MKTISEVASDLNLTKQTIYNKVKNTLKAELSTHVKKNGNVVYISDDGIEIIKKSLKKNRNIGPNVESSLLLRQIKLKDEAINKLLVSLEEQIIYLKSEISIKNEEIKRLKSVENSSSEIEQSKLIQLENKSSSNISEIKELEKKKVKNML